MSEESPTDILQKNLLQKNLLQKNLLQKNLLLKNLLPKIKVGKMTGPSYTKIEGYTPIVVTTRSRSTWYNLSPYYLKTNEGYIMENVWQFSKVYPVTNKSTQYRSRWDKTVIWSHPREVHYKNDALTPEFFQWRAKGFKHSEPVRYPMGYANKHRCVFAVKPTLKLGEITSLKEEDKLNYIDARKQIYMPLYNFLAKKTVEFKDLQKLVASGEKILIIDVDGPHEESLPYYEEKYKSLVSKDFIWKNFIKDGAMDATPENLSIMMNDPKHPFGHGYCLAAALLGPSVEKLLRSSL